MNMVARFWLFLIAFYTVAHGLLLVLVWRTLDLRFEVILQLSAVPFLQAMALAWVAGDWSLKECALAAGRALSRPLVAILWCLEGILLFVYWSCYSGADLAAVVTRTAGIVALLGVLILLIRVLPTAGSRAWISVLPFTMIILLLGSNAIRPWFSILPLWLPENWPFLLRQMLVMVGTVIVLVVLTARAGVAVSARSPIAGLILSWSQVFLIVAVMALAVNGYLYADLTSPWVQIVVSSLSLAATCLLTAALCLPGRLESEETKPFALPQSPLLSASFSGLWFVLALCSVASVVILRVLFFPHWDWSTQTLLSLLLIPLMQASWFLWVQELHRSWRSVILLFKNQFVFFVLIGFEITLFGVIAFLYNFWKISAFPVIVSAWIGLKLAILGAVILRWAFHDIALSKFKVMCGGVTLIFGVGTAFTGEFSAWVWLLPSLGCTFVLMGVSWGPVPLDHGASLAKATAEALVIPLLSMSFCIFVTQALPLVFVIHGGYAMTVIATTFVAMFLNSLSKSHQDIR